MAELGDEGLEERLQSATQAPARPPHRLAQAIAETVPTGRPVLVLELARGPGAEDSSQLGVLAAAALRAGADALCVKTDSDDTPEPLKGACACGGDGRVWVCARALANAGCCGGQAGRGFFVVHAGVDRSSTARAAAAVLLPAPPPARPPPLPSSPLPQTCWR